MDKRSFLLAAPALAMAGCVSVPGAAGPPAPAPTLRVGDRWIYNCADGFRLKVEWTETHEVVGIDATGISVRVTLKGPTIDYSRVELLQSPGVVLIGSIYDNAINRQFKAPFVRYQFPLTPGASWRQIVQYLNPDNQLVSNVALSVTVGGWEAVTTPQGTFDAIVMRTLMSVDDNDPFRWPTQCNYVTWWSPEVGNKVKETKYATYRERGDLSAVEVRAQNMLIELAAFSRAPG